MSVESSTRYSLSISREFFHLMEVVDILLRQYRHIQIEDIELLFPDQMKHQIQRTFKSCRLNFKTHSTIIT